VEDFYPMPMFVILEVGNLPSSADWYQQVLGFRVVFRGPPDNPTMVHLRRERYQDLLLQASRPDIEEKVGRGVLIQFQAGETIVDEIARRARRLGVQNVEGPVERPWNVRDVTISDLDGYRLRFSEPINQDLSFDDVMGSNN
jgi:catechol 2,3-dioxygenase-like lactoylglutathione lyase family enzyme